MEKLLSHPITTAIVASFAIGFVAWLKSQFKTLIRKLEMNHLELKATDYALEKSFGNGYSSYKREKLLELITKSKFVNADDFK